MSRVWSVVLSVACALIAQSIVTGVAWANHAPLPDTTVEPRPAREFIVLGLVVVALAVVCWLVLARVLRTDDPGKRHKRRRRNGREN